MSHPAPPTYQTAVDGVAHHDTDSARQLNARAVTLMKTGDWDGAEKLLKDALTSDIMSGPAHNNLGKVYYHQNKLYLAAWEFQYAMKIMPQQPEPYNNLGLVFESAGKYDDALSWYNRAMEAEPENTQFVGNVARARLRRGDSVEDVSDLLSKVSMRDTRPDWVEWARKELALMHHPTPG
jgi:Tfp pilus assembly protein PilF